MADQELRRKIKKSLDEGYSKEEILGVMEEQGYSKHDIGRAMALLKED